MTVCLTGDVHHMSLGTRDQEYMDRTELEVAVEYSKIAAEYDVPVTLFVTGKAAVEEPNRVKELAAMDNVEIGGHNYWAFDTPVHSAWRALEKFTSGRIGSWNGPRSFQKYEIRRTLDALSGCGADVTSWRDHAYRYDEHTVELLGDAGITHFSDQVGPDKQIRNEGETTVVPVNTPPDHEHIYHAFRTRRSKAVERFEGPFGGESVPVEAWTDWVVDQIEAIQKSGGTATVLAHPSCLWLADEFEAFEELLSAIELRDPRPMHEVVATK